MVKRMKSMLAYAVMIVTAISFGTTAVHMLVIRTCRLIASGFEK